MRHQKTPRAHPGRILLPVTGGVAAVTAGLVALNPFSPAQDAPAASVVPSVVSHGSRAVSGAPGDSYASAFNAQAHDGQEVLNVFAPEDETPDAGEAAPLEVYGYERSGPEVRHFMDRVIRHFPNVGHNDLYVFDREYSAGVFPMLEQNILPDGFYLLCQPDGPPSIFIVDTLGPAGTPRTAQNARVMDVPLAWAKIDEQTREVVGEELLYRADRRIEDLTIWTNVLMKFQTERTMFIRIADNPDLFTVDANLEYNHQLWPHVIEAVPGTPFIVRAPSAAEYDFYDHVIESPSGDDECVSIFIEAEVLVP